MIVGYLNVCALISWNVVLINLILFKKLIEKQMIVMTEKG